jgi:hypothetical protein
VSITASPLVPDIGQCDLEPTLSAAQWTGTLHPGIFFKRSWDGHSLRSLGFNIHQIISLRPRCHWQYGRFQR